MRYNEEKIKTKMIDPETGERLHERAISGHEFEQLYLLNDRQRKLMPARGAFKKIIPFLKKFAHVRDAVREALLENPFCDQQDPVEEKYPWSPPSYWLNALHLEIARELGLKNLKLLRVYPALGLSADYQYGIDLVIVYIDPDTKKLQTVTADLTLDRKKIDDWRRPLSRGKKAPNANILISDFAGIPNKSQFPDFIQRLEYDIPDPKSSPPPYQEYDQKEFSRKQRLAKIIATIIRYKERCGEDEFDLNSDLDFRLPDFLDKSTLDELLQFQSGTPQQQS